MMWSKMPRSNLLAKGRAVVVHPSRILGLRRPAGLLREQVLLRDPVDALPPHPEGRHGRRRRLRGWGVQQLGRARLQALHLHPRQQAVRPQPGRPPAWAGALPGGASFQEPRLSSCKTPSPPPLLPAGRARLVRAPPEGGGPPDQAGLRRHAGGSGARGQPRKGTGLHHMQPALKVRCCTYSTVLYNHF